MKVISNTSPLTNLVAIGQFHLLHYLYFQILIPQAVWDELNRNGKAWPGSQEVASAHWIKIETVQNRPLVISLQRDLHAGEAEAITLAVEAKADLLLLDEREGRHAAQRQGIAVLGTIGVLLAAKAGGHIERVRPYLDSLRHNAGFYMNQQVYMQAIRLADES
jgi:predicted nucleic acid-binding protein